MSRLLYTIAWLLALPFALLRLGWRGMRERGYWHGISERLAIYGGPQPRSQPIWIHAVSVGETRAAQPLVEALLARSDQTRILLTQMTPTGRRTAQSLFGRHGDRVAFAYLPWDLPWLARRFLRHYSPRAGALMETEVWPNLVIEAKALGIPLALVNARLSARSARRYGRLRRFSGQVFGALALVAAQTEADAGRLRACGAPEVIVSGNLKFDIAPPADQLELAQTFRGWRGARRTILAASTREGEEIPLLAAFMQYRRPGDLLILVPRHPQRFAEVAALARAQGLPVALRSAAKTIEAATEVWIGDSMGEMFAYYAAADVALIGGSWQPLGGQNLIEACAVGTPVVMGPHTFNFAEASRLAIEAGAALRAEDVDHGMRLALALLDQAAERASMAAAGKAFARAHGGATEKTVRLLDGLANAHSHGKGGEMG